MSEDISTEFPPVKYNLNEAVVAKMEEEFLPLKVQGIEDPGGLASVHDARMVVKKARVELEKSRVALKAKSLAFGRQVDTEAKMWKARLQPIEDHLAAEENKIKEEKARIKAEKEREEEERLQSRVNLLQRFGKQVFLVNLKAMSDEDFQAAYDEAKVEAEAEKVRLTQEAKEREEREEVERVERETEEARLAEERAELDRIAKEQEEREAALKVEADRIEAKRHALAEEKRLEEAKKEAAERTLKEERERVQRETEEKEEADRRAEEEATRQEALRPDKEKLETYGDALLEFSSPTVKDEEARAIAGKVKDMIEDVVSVLRKAIAEM